ncbi:MAG: zf-HC2 domain-containing protein [Vicinamibacterales bacterium]
MSAHADGSPVIDVAVLVDYWLGALPPIEEDALEEHLMACDVCADRLRDATALADGLRELARSGTLQVIVDDAFAARAAAGGLRVREYAPLLGGSVQCTVAADDDLLVSRLAADLSNASRVDISFCDLRGIEYQRMEDIPFHDRAAAVVCQHSITWVKASPTASLMARLLAIDERGRERVLGEYTFHHTRTIPGPPGWQLP